MMKFRLIGSCNDILELEIKPNEPPVQLQIGPKKYAYGPFVKALELCRDDMTNDEASSKNDDINATTNDRTEQSDEAEDDENGEMDDDDDDDDDGLAAFLDSCDNDNEEDDDEDESNGFDDYLYNAPMKSIDIVNAKLSSPGALISSDIRALEALQDILQSVHEGLVANALYQTSHNNNTRNNDEIQISSSSNITVVEERYCSILIHSEIQTVDFYMAVVRELRRRLLDHSEASQECSVVKKPKTSTTETISSLSTFVNSVVDAFVSIRHPHIKKDN